VISYDCGAFLSRSLFTINKFMAIVGVTEVAVDSAGPGPAGRTPAISIIHIERR